MSIAVGDELGDVESWDLTKCRDEVKELQNDRERRIESTERLQEKLKALNNELAARRLEGEQKQQELKEQQKRNRERADKERQGESVDQGDSAAMVEHQREEYLMKVRNVLEEMVAEKAAGPNKKDKARTQYGFRVFDETELMVEKPVDDEAKDAPVDTVLVIYQKPNSDDVRYYLTYRVAPNTPSKKLREDACNFWNLSEVEYILLTVDNSKVHDELILQNCFNSKEKYQLILAPKEPTRTALMQREIEVTKPSGGGKKASKANQKITQEEITKRGNAAQNFYDWMESKPGIWSYMTQRDRNRVDHLTRIPFSSILIYVSMLLLTVCILYILVPPGRMYYMRFGPMTTLTADHTFVDADGTHHIPEFYKIKTQEEAYDWLKYLVPHALLNSTSEFRYHNYLNGWLRIRMQQVAKPEHSSCEMEDLVPDSTLCVESHYSSKTAGTENLPFLHAYWEGYNLSNASNSSRRLTYGMAAWTNQYLQADGSYNLSGLAEQPRLAGTDGRSIKTSPWKYMENEQNELKHEIEVIVGVVQRYDPSGYNLDYDLQYKDFPAMFNAYQADITAVKERGWFTKRTRAIFTHFTFYNANYDLWANCDFVFEMNAASVVYPTLKIDIFSASLKDTQHSKWLFWMDVVRMVLGLYCGTIQVCYELRMCKEREESKWWSYLFTPLGLCDLGVCFLVITIFLLRDVMLGMVYSSEDYLKDVIEKDDFVSSAQRAWLFRFGMQIEGPLFGLLILRSVSFLRMNRHIYVVWQSMWECGKRHLPYLLIFAPIMLGFTIWAHTLYSVTEFTYTDVPSSFISVIMMALGDVHKDRMFLMHRPNTFIFAICYYCAVYLFLINTWVACIVWVYEKVRVEAGYCPNDYRWKEKHYVNWLLWKPLARIYFQKLRPGIDRPKEFVGGDEDDE